jgi:sigma-E factor negative regulatory protein RseC
MIEQNVQVVRCGDERVWVRMGSQSGCAACDNGQGCGAGVFAKLLRRKPVVIEVAHKGLKAEPGQMVTLAFPERIYLKLVLASYAWPLLAALAGAIAGHGLGTWLKMGPAMNDMLTLGCGLLAGALVMNFVGGRQKLDAALKSLQVSACRASVTPDMCTGSGSDLT